jgi:resuscitation-promoting factor RpfA
MRNLLRRTPLLFAAVLMAITLLSSDVFSAEPAGAMSVSRRSSPVVRSSTKAQRSPAVRRVRPRRVRSRFARASRSAVRVLTGDVWAKLRACESGGRYNVNTGNGFYGAYQFHPRTWRGLGYPGLPHQAPPEMQDEAARKLQARSGWGQWPVCSRRIGARR